MLVQDSDMIEQFEKFGKEDELQSIERLRNAWADNHAKRMAELEQFQ